MKKKAIILTFHCVDNYGAILQCLGLQEKLKKFFDEVEVLDYRPEYLTKDYRLIATDNIKSMLMSLYSLPSFGKKRCEFKKFRDQYINLSKKVYYKVTDIQNIDVDCIFLGSDQIWNSKITNGYDPVFFGRFPGSEKAKTISYAASFGQATLDETEATELVGLVSAINHVGVREKEAAELLKHTRRDVSLVIDPTLLIEPELWQSFVKKSDLGNYVLIYNLTDAPELAKMAKDISQKLGAKVIEISGKRKNLKKKSEHKTIYAASPEDFLSLIANAKYVVTDSFHGTAFSIIFKKEFVVVPHKTRGGRMKTLLEMLGLEARIRALVDESFLCEKIDYLPVFEKLSERRKDSEKFILESIEG